jgi:SAM-dependent methyltransferase
MISHPSGVSPRSGQPTHLPRIFTPEYYERLRELERTSWWNAGMRDVAAELLGLAALRTAGVMVDVGCGSGQTMTWFAGQHPRWRTLGLDVAAEGLAAAKTLGASRVLRASALRLPLASNTIDLIVSLDVLQHLPLGVGDRQALAEMARVLRPGGYLLLRTNAQSFPYTPDDPVFQFHKYNPAELRARVEEAGLRVVRLGRLNALLGLAEMPAEIRGKIQPHSYQGLRAAPRLESRWRWAAKRAWLRVEGRAVRFGLSWPLGRTIMALCRRET